MNKTLTCIECPKGCILLVKIQHEKVKEISGNICSKGKAYAVSEIEHPCRMLTSTVCGKGLNLRMIPVKTNAPIPKSDIFKAMKEIKKLKIRKSVCAGDIIVRNFLGLKGINLVVARSCSRI
ncbi:MAG: DUF1667 domain-containing protein [Candidatus Omnitrophica bacterium]|nr:DUF1667 domain-containing protein [Candidatus Omnitrophota bacterium]